jgi:hypothetical protein
MALWPDAFRATQTGKSLDRQLLPEIPLGRFAAFVQQSAPAAVFLQNGRNDEQIPQNAWCERLCPIWSTQAAGVLRLRHALNEAARLDEEGLQHVPDLL